MEFGFNDSMLEGGRVLQTCCNHQPVVVDGFVDGVRQEQDGDGLVDMMSCCHHSAVLTVVTQLEEHSGGIKVHVVGVDKRLAVSLVVDKSTNTKYHVYGSQRWMCIVKTQIKTLFYCILQK